MRLDAHTIRDAATGRWPAIFALLGIEVGTGKHRACPACGGKDRFRFDDRDGRGSWFCNQCDPQAGDGFRLVQHVRGCDFPEALKIVAGVLGLDHAHASTHRSLTSPMIRFDQRALAFRYDLAALDLRLRAEHIVEVGKKLNMASLSDDDLDRALNHMAKAHADGERAELFEGVADDLRMKDFLEKDHARHERFA